MEGQNAVEGQYMLLLFLGSPRFSMRIKQLLFLPMMHILCVAMALILWWANFSFVSFDAWILAMHWMAVKIKISKVQSHSKIFDFAKRSILQDYNETRNEPDKNVCLINRDSILVQICLLDFFTTLYDLFPLLRTCCQKNFLVPYIIFQTPYWHYLRPRRSQFWRLGMFVHLCTVLRQ